MFGEGRGAGSLQLFFRGLTAWHSLGIAAFACQAIREVGPACCHPAGAGQGTLEELRGCVAGVVSGEGMVQRNSGLSPESLHDSRNLQSSWSLGFLTRKMR